MNAEEGASRPRTCSKFGCRKNCHRIRRQKAWTTKLFPQFYGALIFFVSVDWWVLQIFLGDHLLLRGKTMISRLSRDTRRRSSCSQWFKTRRGIEAPPKGRELLNSFKSSCHLSIISASNRHIWNSARHSYPCTLTLTIRCLIRRILRINIEYYYFVHRMACKKA